MPKKISHKDFDIQERKNEAEKKRVARKNRLFEVILKMLKPSNRMNRLSVSKEGILWLFCTQYVQDYPQVLENNQPDNLCRIRRTVIENGETKRQIVGGRFLIPFEDNNIHEIIENDSPHEETVAPPNQYYYQRMYDANLVELEEEEIIDDSVFWAQPISTSTPIDVDLL